MNQSEQIVTTWQVVTILAYDICSIYNNGNAIIILYNNALINISSALRDSSYFVRLSTVLYNLGILGGLKIPDTPFPQSSGQIMFSH